MKIKYQTFFRLSHQLTFLLLNLVPGLKRHVVALDAVGVELDEAGLLAAEHGAPVDKVLSQHGHVVRHLKLLLEKPEIICRCSDAQGVPAGL